MNSVEAAFALKTLVNSLDGIIECRVDGIDFPPKNRSAYVGNVSIEEIDDAKEIIIIGANPANDSPVIT